jgi:uncharacterized YigZ family protein
MEQTYEHLKEGQYLSIALPSNYEITIKHSRFIAFLRIASDRHEFDQILKQIVAQYPKANHYCWAYRFNTNPITEHASDAGEPSGTAGRPILGALKKHFLMNTAAIVARYYGGVKLGVRGLITAYTEITLSAIKNTNIIICEPVAKISFKCSYETYNLLLALAQKYKIESANIRAAFTGDISGEIILPKSFLNNFSNELDAFSGGRDFSYSILAS